MKRKYKDAFEEQKARNARKDRHKQTGDRHKPKPSTAIKVFTAHDRMLYERIVEEKENRELYKRIVRDKGVNNG